MFLGKRKRNSVNEAAKAAESEEKEDIAAETGTVENDEEIDDFDIIEKPVKAVTVEEKSAEESEPAGENNAPETEDDFDEPSNEKEEAPEPKETEEEKAEKLEKLEKRAELMRSVKKAAKISGITAAALAVIYLAGIGFYRNHFFFGTRIGNYKCSNMSPARAEEHIRTGISNYKYKVIEKNGVESEIRGEDVGLANGAMQDLSEIKKMQNVYLWPVFWMQRKLPVQVDISLDEELLRNKISELKSVKDSIPQIDGAYAGFYFDEGSNSFKIKDDGTHCIVSERELFDKISSGMKGLYADINLEQEGIYGGLEKADRVNDVLWQLNRANAMTVTYKRGDESIVLDGGTIHTWLSVDENYVMQIDNGGVAQYVSELAFKFDTVGSTRTFKGSGGDEVTVYGGDYGWRVNQSAEIEALKDIVTVGDSVEREPVFRRRGGSFGKDNDLPNTYIEVSISAQHLWYYKDGEQIISSDVVTGNPLAGNGTHTGVFYIKYKEKDATLKGEDYETPVDFWMPFNGGEGLHDAKWRGAFGGRIYMGGGSHGCVNCPPAVAQKLFENITPGTAVIVY